MPIYELLNKYRVIPRFLVVGYSYLLYEVSYWFMGLVDPTGTQAAFVSTMVGISAAIFGLYTNSGPKD